MGPSDERVTERLAALREAHPQTPVEQNTSMVDPETRARIEASTHILRARVRVENGDGEVLCVANGNGWEAPCVPVPENVHIGTEADAVVRQAVEETTGVEPVLEDIQRVTITGYHCEECSENGERVYRLTAEYLGTPEAGSPADGAEWRQLDK